jgi:hypothetical protein
MPNDCTPCLTRQEIFPCIEYLFVGEDETDAVAIRGQALACLRAEGDPWEILAQIAPEDLAYAQAVLASCLAEYWQGPPLTEAEADLLLHYCPICAADWGETAVCTQCGYNDDEA